MEKSFPVNLSIAKHATTASTWFICIGALTFPFSVAVANITFACVILLSLFSGQFREGTQWLWQQHRHASLAILTYLGLVCIGLLWSIDPKAGLRVLSHQWMWLLLPPLLAALISQTKLRHRFWASLCIGLTLHLAFCVVQMSGWGNMHIMGGSTPDDATGYIGHIGFGLVYGVWAGWLLHFGYLTNVHWQRWGAWALALWTLFMIFAAQGRSGYLITIAILAFLVWTHFIKDQKLSTILAVCLLGSTMFTILLLNNLDHPRIKFTLNSIQAIAHGDMQHTEERGRLWIDAVHIWQKHPILGVGTGGYQQATQIKIGESSYDHPHQAYLLALLRWGPIGSVILILLLLCLFRAQPKTIESDSSSPLNTSYGLIGKLAILGLTIHGLSSNPLEEHASMMMAMFAIAVALSSTAPQGSQENLEQVRS